jgi:hypothetical protein
VAGGEALGTRLVAVGCWAAGQLCRLPPIGGFLAVRRAKWGGAVWCLGGPPLVANSALACWRRLTPLVTATARFDRRPR